jgi:hypothetical protein
VQQVPHLCPSRLRRLTRTCSYISHCISARALLEQRPKFFLLTSAATAAELAKDYDQWGDPDSEDVDMEVRSRLLIQ